MAEGADRRHDDGTNPEPLHDGELFMKDREPASAASAGSTLNDAFIESRRRARSTPVCREVRS